MIAELTRVRNVTWDLSSDVLARQVVTVLDGLTLQFLIDRDAAAAHAALRAFAGDLAGHARPQGADTTRRAR